MRLLDSIQVAIIKSDIQNYFSETFLQLNMIFIIEIQVKDEMKNEIEEIP